MEDVDGIVKPLLRVDIGCHQAVRPSRGQQLVADPVQADGVVILDVAIVVGTEDGAQVHARRQFAVGGRGIPGLHSEALGVLGDEYPVELVGGSLGGLDAVPAMLGDEPALV